MGPGALGLPSPGTRGECGRIDAVLKRMVASNASRVPRRVARAGEAAGRKLMERNPRVSTEDEIGDRVPHGGSVEDALARAAGGHVDAIETGHAAEHE